MAEGGGDGVISISSFDSRHAKIKQLLTCPICKKFLREVATIDECLHIFCRKCITGKITEERLQNCPVCKVDLGVFPLQKLRPDYRWQSIRNCIKFKRQQFIERGLIQRKPRKPQASIEPKEPEVLPPDHSPPVGRKEKSPVRRKEKSISSVLRAEKASNKHSPPNGRRKPGRRKANHNPPRRTSLIIKETKDQQESLSNSVKLGNGERGRKQTTKPSKQELSNDNKRQRINQQKEGKNAFLKPLDHCLVGSAGTSKANMTDDMLVQAAPISEARGNKENKDNNKGKSKEHTSNCNSSRDQYNDESGSVSLPTRSGRARNGNRAQEKRPVVTEDLNLPAQVYLDASSSKCFRSNQIWFSLVASDKQETYVPLPPLPPCYLTVKDPKMPASFLRKYLVKKLRLYSENEVELSMRGTKISPDCPLEKVVDLWMQTTPSFEKKPGLVGDSAQDFVMVVTYGRNTTLPY